MEPDFQDTPPAEHPKQVSFEFQRVRMLLTHFGLSASIPEILIRHRKLWGFKRLTFTLFYDFFPRFPVLFEAHSFFHTAEKLTPVALFRHFERSFVFQRYLTVFAANRERSAGRPVGMVFPFAGYQGGLVMHNGIFDTGGFRWVYDVPGDAPPHRVTVEPFASFVRFLAKAGWTPESPLTLAPVQRLRRKCGCWLCRWVVRILGAGAAAVVLSWLLRVLRTRPGVYESGFIHACGGQRYAAADHETVARETGLSEPQVKRAVDQLRERSFISTRPLQYKGMLMTHFLIDRQALRDARARRRDRAL